MPSTSVPASGSVMHMPPIHSPDMTVGQDAAALRRRRVAVEVVHEEHAVREVGEAEARVGGRQRLVHDHRRRRVEPGAAVVLGHREPEQPELAGAAEQRRG